MLNAGAWKRGQPNLITFVLVGSNGQEVTGLGTGWTVQISKAGGAFANGAGTKAEIGSGWYSYLATASEADTVGPVAVKITHAGIVQQNLEYVVEDRVISAVEFTYTVTSSVGGTPIDGVQVWITTDNLGGNVVWSGFTDMLGVARDEYGNLPRLDPGTYYFWRNRAGYVFDDPDQEVVGP